MRPIVQVKAAIRTLWQPLDVRAKSLALSLTHTRAHTQQHTRGGELRMQRVGADRDTDTDTDAELQKITPKTERLRALFVFGALLRSPTVAKHNSKRTDRVWSCFRPTICALPAESDGSGAGRSVFSGLSAIGASERASDAFAKGKKVKARPA